MLFEIKIKSNIPPDNKGTAMLLNILREVAFHICSPFLAALLLESKIAETKATNKTAIPRK